jgi:pyruvate,water dikinase
LPVLVGLGVVVGCGDATQKLRDGQQVTVSCAEGDAGHVYEGLLQFQQQQVELIRCCPRRSIDECSNPDRAFASPTFHTRAWDWRGWNSSSTA